MSLNLQYLFNQIKLWHSQRLSEFEIKRRLEALLATEFNRAEFENTINGLLPNFSANLNSDPMLMQILNSNYTYFASQQTGCNVDILKAVYDHFSSDIELPEKELRNNLNDIMNKYKQHAYTVANTAYRQIENYNTVSDAERDGITKFKYFGPPPERNFCRQYWNKIVTVAELKNITNDFGQSAWIACGGWNCRHHWIPIIR